MIKVTKLNGDGFYINPLLIERIEERPDTIVTMNSQVQFLIKEKALDVIDLIRSSCLSDLNVK